MCANRKLRKSQIFDNDINIEKLDTRPGGRESKCRNENPRYSAWRKGSWPAPEKKKKESQGDSLFEVIPERFERSTYSLEGCYNVE